MGPHRWQIAPDLEGSCIRNPVSNERPTIRVSWRISRLKFKNHLSTPDEASCERGTRIIGHEQDCWLLPGSKRDMQSSFYENARFTLKADAPASTRWCARLLQNIHGR